MRLAAFLALYTGKGVSPDVNLRDLISYMPNKAQISVTLLEFSLFGRIPIGVKIKVHNVLDTHTSIYSKLILTMVSNMFYNFLDFITQ